LEPLLQVGRTISLRLWIREVSHCDGQRGFEQVLNFGKKSYRKVIKWIGQIGAQTEEAIEQDSFLSRDAHALSEDGIEPANRVTDRDQAARKVPKFFKMPLYAGRKDETSDLPNLLCTANCIVDGWCSQFLGECPSMSPGGESPWLPPSEIVHRSFSSGKMKAPRLLLGALGRWRSVFQSVGASSGISKMAVE
jgi:hypothetical protein